MNKTLLLTGFEQFGGAELNPSYEALKGLDGTRINCWTIRTARLDVAWDSPMKQLRSLIEEHEPHTIISFGQGKPRSFTVEAVARNQRKILPDNLRKLPSTQKILADGPDAYSYEARAEAVAQELSDRGFRIRVSRNAGGYLCEECLYSARHLMAKGEIEGKAMFFHVPPLGTFCDGRTVDVSYVREFVKATAEVFAQSTQPAQ
ncbi:MAG: hypothetical protein U5N86_13905 [Planctomycetota bacterium]|nr:hypothetical protein [Planctomycetota bacterium]